MLAVVRAIERFHLYLYGLEFKVVTDCNALVYATNKASLNPRIARWVLSLQNYKFRVEHRPGKKMPHVDALSRAVGTVSDLTLEQKLEYKQLSDAFIKEIANKLEIRDDPKFSLVDGLVYKNVDNNLKFVVPESMIMQLLHAYHDDMAHCGAKKTLEELRITGFPLCVKK